MPRNRTVWSGQVADLIESRVTIRDVACLAGVSKSTVSLVLNGGAGVAEATATRVRTMLERTGYSRDPSALRFCRKRPGPIGVALTGAPDAPTAAFLAGLSERLTEAGQAILVSVSGDAAKAGGTLRDEGASALVVEGMRGASIVPDCPVLMLHRGTGGEPCARIDGTQALRLAARAVKAQGAKRLVLLGALAALGDDVPESAGGLDIVRAADHATTLGAEDGLICSSALASRLRPQVGAPRLICLGGEAVPDGPSRICWDGHALGRAAADALVARLGGDMAAPVDIVAPVWLSVAART